MLALGHHFSASCYNLKPVHHNFKKKRGCRAFSCVHWLARAVVLCSSSSPPWVFCLVLRGCGQIDMSPRVHTLACSNTPWSGWAHTCMHAHSLVLASCYACILSAHHTQCHGQCFVAKLILESTENQVLIPYSDWFYWLTDFNCGDKM